MSSSPFNNKNYNLGSDTIEDGSSANDISESIKSAHLSTGILCYICKRAGTHKLIAKVSHLDTEELRKIGYVCKDCLSKHVNPLQYGIREI